jgi:hypothetical protein
MNSRVPALEVGLQSATKNSEAPRQMQVFQWPGKVEGSRLALQEGQVVARVEGDLLFVPVPRVGGHHVGAGDDVHRVDPAETRHVVIGEVGGHRVVVAVEAHERQRVHRGLDHPAGLEGLGRQRQHGGPVDLQPLGLALGLAPDPSVEVGEAAGGQVLVQFDEAGEARDRHQQVPPRVADVVLDVALLVAASDPTEVMVEEVVALQAQELRCQFPLTTHHLLHGDACVVIVLCPPRLCGTLRPERVGTVVNGHSELAAGT